jgi:hypothetical protein
VHCGTAGGPLLVILRLLEIVRSELAGSAFTAAQLELHSNVALRAIKHACE